VVAAILLNQNLPVICKGNGEVKVVPDQAMKEQGRRGIVPLILNLDTRRRRVPAISIHY
jgi:hypothetical protein